MSSQTICLPNTGTMDKMTTLAAIVGFGLKAVKVFVSSFIVGVAASISRMLHENKGC